MEQRLQNNEKISFAAETSIFWFWKRFNDAQDLLNVLNDQKIGVLENKDLYDDISKEDLAKLKKAKLLREIVIKEKKTKDSVIILFSYQNPSDEIESLNIEEKTNSLIKSYWDSYELYENQTEFQDAEN